MTSGKYDERIHKRLKEHELLGVAELAEVLGISTALLGVWMKRGKAPPPDYKLRSSSIWRRTTVEKWLDEHT